MKKQYVAVAAVVLGLVATPAIASAVGNQQEPNQSVDRVDQGWMNEMHDSVWGPDGVRPGYEWMTEMHDSMWNGDTSVGYGSMMGGSTPGSSSSQHFNGTRMGGGS